MDFTEISYLSYTSWDSSWRNQKQSSLESKYSHQLSLSCCSCQCTLSAWGCQRLFSCIFSIFYLVFFALLVCKLSSSTFICLAPWLSNWVLRWSLYENWLTHPMAVTEQDRVASFSAQLVFHTSVAVLFIFGGPSITASLPTQNSFCSWLG